MNIFNFFRIFNDFGWMCYFNLEWRPCSEDSCFTYRFNYTLICLIRVERNILRWEFVKVKTYFSRVLTKKEYYFQEKGNVILTNNSEWKFPLNPLTFFLPFLLTSLSVTTKNKFYSNKIFNFRQFQLIGGIAAPGPNKQQTLCLNNLCLEVLIVHGNE